MHKWIAQVPLPARPVCTELPDCLRRQQECWTAESIGERVRSCTTAAPARSVREVADLPYQGTNVSAARARGGSCM